MMEGFEAFRESEGQFRAPSSANQDGRMAEEGKYSGQYQLPGRWQEFFGG